MRAVAKTDAWQNWERDFPKKFGRPGTDKTVLGKRKEWSQIGGREEQQETARVTDVTYGTRKEQRKQS